MREKLNIERRMEAKEKAKEIVKKYHSLEVCALNYKQVYIEDAKEQAKICVEEIINSSKEYFKNTTYDEYWKDVLTEIDNL